MQLPWDEHFDEIVLPAWQAYLNSECALTAATQSNDFIDRVRARYTALREAGAASFYLHHFGEIVLRARPEWLPPGIKGPGQLRQWLGSYCTALRTDKPMNDVDLLADVADALKHAVLTRHPEKRLVSANDAVLVSESGYGGGSYGEGKFGGVEQVLVLSVTGQRALSGVLQNVVDAWRRAASQELPPIGAI